MHNPAKRLAGPAVHPAVKGPVQPHTCDVCGPSRSWDSGCVSIHIHRYIYVYHIHVRILYIHIYVFINVFIFREREIDSGTYKHLGWVKCAMFGVPEPLRGGIVGRRQASLLQCMPDRKIGKTHAKSLWNT